MLLVALRTPPMPERLLELSLAWMAIRKTAGNLRPVADVIGDCEHLATLA